MLAEGSVALFQPTLVLHLEVELIDPLSESIFVHIDGNSTNFGWVELLKAEGIHHDFARDNGCRCLHLFFFPQFNISMI